MSNYRFLETLNTSRTEVSIVIPIANHVTAAKFIYQYLSYAPSAVEFILVYDGLSVEHIPRIKSELEKFANTRIVAIQCDVHAPGLARNWGLLQATGRWVAFWDCDDTVDLNLFLSEFRQVKDSKADIVIWNFKKASNFANQKRSFQVFHESSILNVATSPGIWRMLFKHSLISDTVFTKLLWGEDQLFFCSVLSSGPEIVFREESFYEYSIGNPDQLTAKRCNAPDLEIASQEVTKLLMKDTGVNKDIAQVAQIVLMGIYLTQLKYSTIAKLPRQILRVFCSSSHFSAKNRRRALFLILKARRLRNSEVLDGAVVISLTGGLGNQLFQYTAGLSLSHLLKKELLIEKDIGKPRTNALGAPSLFSMVNEDAIAIFGFKRFKSIFRRLTNFKLRVSLNEKKSLLNRLNRYAVRLASYLLSPYFFSGLRNLEFITPDNLGYQEIFSRKQNLFVRGYFQTYRYLETGGIYEKLMKVKPHNLSADLVKLSNDISSKRVLIVHLRLSDYLGLEEFGIPSSTYYSDAINEVQELSTIDEIWLFSDQPHVARENFETEGINNVKVIENFGNDDSQIWELMRYGSAYVIGNSTFAWWAAKLSYNPNAIVICPSPWFKKVREPSHLIPPNWLRRDAKFN
jgi:hypothetical protein